MGKKELIITKIFDSSVEQVWKMTTEPVQIMKWWGPKYFIAPFIKVDFYVGGKYLYCMRGSIKQGYPDRDYWSTGVYKEIIPLEKIVCTDSFSNKNGDIVDPMNYGMPKEFPKENIMTMTFEKIDENKTKLTILYSDLSDDVFKIMIDTQIKEFWEGSLEKLKGNLIS